MEEPNALCLVTNAQNIPNEETNGAECTENEIEIHVRVYSKQEKTLEQLLHSSLLCYERIELTKTENNASNTTKKKTTAAIKIKMICTLPVQLLDQSNSNSKTFRLIIYDYIMACVCVYVWNMCIWIVLTIYTRGKYIYSVIMWFKVTNESKPNVSN